MPTIRSAADMQRKLTPPSLIVGVKGRWLRLIALADPRHFGSDRIRARAVARRAETPEDDFVLEPPPVHFNSSPFHERLLRHGQPHRTEMDCRRQESECTHRTPCAEIFSRTISTGPVRRHGLARHG